ncbi:ankyrin-3-like [Hyalella azteca]|uniref:Ankyrin-3-like n=1 Tax=Hyalella azteca TaxID=294128 RepID=A0A8B7PHP9_HYAAZ|nr:ankyrin-3-like [Hyalella azteca]
MLRGADCNELGEYGNPFALYVADKLHQSYADQDNKLRPIAEKVFMEYPSAVINFSESYEYPRLLSYFFKYGRLEVIKTLLNALNDVEKKTRILNNGDNSCTPLGRVNGSDILSDCDRLKITKYLLHNGGIRTTHSVSMDSDISRILLAATSNGHIKTMKYFIEKEDSCNYHNHLYHALEKNQEEIVHFLIAEYRNEIRYEGNTIFHFSVMSTANLTIIKFLLDGVKDINSQNDLGETPLMVAVKARRELEVIKYLIDNGSNLNLEDKAKHTPLYHALKDDQVEVIKYLIQCGARLSKDLNCILTKNRLQFFKNSAQFDLNGTSYNGLPRLQNAIRYHYFDWAKFIIHHGGNVNVEDINGRTPLHVAAQFGCYEIMRLLFQFGAIYDKADKSLIKPVDLCKYQEFSMMFDELDKLFNSQDLDKSFNALDPANWLGWTFKDAWDPGNPMLFMLNVRNHDGKSLLHIAAIINDCNALKTLLSYNDAYLQRKADEENLEFDPYFLQKKNIEYGKTFKYYLPISVNVLDLQNNSPLHYAAQEGNEKLVSFLLEQGASYNTRNKQGKTPNDLSKKDKIIQLFSDVDKLFDAAEEVSNDFTALISQEFKYINVKNESAKTLLHVVILSGRSNVNVIKFLLKKGVDKNFPDINGNTPLHYAVENDNFEVVKLLLRVGAIYDVKNNAGKAPFELVDNRSATLLTSIDHLFSLIKSDSPESIMKESIITNQDDRFNFILNTHDNQGKTILYYASKFGYLNIVKYLLQYGATFVLITKRFSSPVKVFLASILEMFDDIDSVYEMVRKTDIQIIINVRNVDGKTLLHIAVEKGSIKLFRHLIEKGANINSEDIYGNKPLDCDPLGVKEILQEIVEMNQVDQVNF